jgi:hypothetical protein
MATIENLSGKSISEMSKEELLEHLRQIRKSRRIPKQKPKASKKRKALPKDTVNGMTKEQAEALLKKLGG